MFLGSGFTGDTTPTIISSGGITNIELAKSIFLEMLVTNDAISPNGEINDEWSFNTRLHAYFDGSMIAGNVDFTEETVSYVRIKRKTKHDTTFKTIYEREINSKEDLAIELIDYYEPAGEVEYAYVPVYNNIESNYITTKVESKFDSWFIIEKNVSYPIVLNASASETVNYQTGTVKPIGRKYPISVVNGKTGYKSGKMDALFLDLGCFGEIKEDPRIYRERIYSFLTDAAPKILKSFDGELYMVNVDGEITENERDVYYHNGRAMQYVTSSFSWVECGDAYDPGDLYLNGFTDAM